jgi:hypothetical protein
VKRLSVNEVSEVLLSEKKTAKLTKLDPQWIIRLGDTLVFLGERRREALAEEKGTAFEIYDDELRKSRKLRKQILEIREKKIMDLAWSAREDVRPKTKNMLVGEKRLYMVLTKLLREWRESLSERTEFDPELILDHDSENFGEESESPVDEEGQEPSSEAEDSTGTTAVVEEAGPKAAYGTHQGPEPVEIALGSSQALNDGSGKGEEEIHQTESEPVPEPKISSQKPPAEDALPEPESQAALIQTRPEEDQPLPPSPEAAHEEDTRDGEKDDREDTREPTPGETELSEDEEDEESDSPQSLITIGILANGLDTFLDSRGKVYNLRKGELVHIPEEEARLLIENGLAREIGGSA